MSLTSDKARLRTEDDTKESKLANGGGFSLRAKHLTLWRWVKMSNLGDLFLQLKKEIVEFVRDWRTLLALVVIPLLIFPAFLLHFHYCWNLRLLNLML